MRKIEKVGEYTRTRQPLLTYKQTVADCFDLARLYWKDLLLFKANGVPIEDLSIREFYEYIKSIRYVKDPDRKEHVSRPKILLERANTDHPFDCDDRSILSLSFFLLQNNLKGTKFKTRLTVTGRYGVPKHIYVEFKDENNLESQWSPYDCTYPWNNFGKTLYIPQFKRVFYEENHPVKKH
ncbi:hypothetical protein [Leptospira meyeri]|uniref:hypothetical protein n=1 Tax=Leptospira meyeri TaxID=29508 RepID=UPI0010825D2B|nr:hypothetical protein [Leptospira meyeri]TGL12425.1 hypothetical protein EHQ50_11540 [Leptospira meyeri]